jgi:heme-degrading monooxygenase HmoA
MFARMTVIQIVPERIEEAIDIYKKSVVPAARMQKGFRGIHLLVDHSSGKGVSLTYWKSEQDAAFNEANLYYQEQLAKFLDLFAAPPIREGYNVVVHASRLAKG